MEEKKPRALEQGYIDAEWREVEDDPAVPRRRERPPPIPRGCPGYLEPPIAVAFVACAGCGKSMMPVFGVCYHCFRRIR